MSTLLVRLAGGTGATTTPAMGDIPGPASLPGMRQHSSISSSSAVEHAVPHSMFRTQWSGDRTTVDSRVAHEDEIEEEFEDDALESAIASEPFRNFTAREEAMSFAAQERMENGHAHRKQSGESGYGSTSRARSKRRRLDRGDGDHSMANVDPLESADEDDDWVQSPIQEKGDHLRNATDPVAMGLLSEKEGRRLLDACVEMLVVADARFYKYAHPFTPVFDPREDTWDRYGMAGTAR